MIPYWNLDNYVLLEINLETGRHHQIRCQLSVSGHPIKGDLKYGSKRSNPNGGIHLHAVKIEFDHPVTKETLSFGHHCQMIRSGNFALRNYKIRLNINPRSTILLLHQNNIPISYFPQIQDKENIE